MMVVYDPVPAQFVGPQGLTGTLQYFVAIGILLAAALGALALKIGPTASAREERALKWIAVLGPIIAMGALLVALQQWWLARDTNEKTLRAYVMLDDSRIDDLEPGKLARVSVIIRNFGSTPALQVRHNISTMMVPTNSELPPGDLAPRV
jgi:hypothetical protein